VSLRRAWPRVLRLLPVLLSIVWLNACQTPPRQTEPQLSPARKALETLQSPEQITTQAAQVGSADRPYYLLKAAWLYAQAGKWSRASDTLNSFSARSLEGSYRADYVALAANAAFSRKRPEQALRYLTTDKFGLFDVFDSLPPEKQVDIAQLRARAWYETGNYMASARERVYYANLMPPERQANNEKAIWQALMEIPTTQLKQVSEATPQGELQGWLQLAYLSKSHQDDVNTQWQLVEQWSARWSAHPAAKRLPGNLAALKQVATEQINVIAVILSSDPKLAPASDAIRDGILAARYRAAAQNQKTPELKFYYHTGTTRFLDTYLAAVKEGANIILGPLEKEQVRLLQQQPSLAVPTLALNYGQDTAKNPANLFQFGLASEDEARQVAEQAHKAGYSQAAMVYPLSEWGNRVATEFSKSWVELNGSVTARVAYSAGGDINKQLRQMLKIEASETRFRQLQRVFDENIRFTPRARKDIDYVFMLAVPDHARQIKPSLSFLAGSSLPVYSTSLMYGANPNQALDQELDSVVFCDIPWVLGNEDPVKNDLLRAKQNPDPRVYRLYALGADAYRLFQQIRLLTAFPNSSTFGATGTLTLTPDKRVVRSLPWARMENGAPKLIPAQIDNDDALKGIL